MLSSNISLQDNLIPNILLQVNCSIQLITQSYNGETGGTVKKAKSVSANAPINTNPPPPPTRIRVGLCGGIDSKISPRGGAFVKMADSVWCAWESTRERSASLPHQMDTNPHLIPTPEWGLGGGLHQKKCPRGGAFTNPTCQIPTLTRHRSGIVARGAIELCIVVWKCASTIFGHTAYPTCLQSTPCMHCVGGGYDN